MTSCEESSRQSIKIYSESKQNIKQGPTALGHQRENNKRSMLQSVLWWPFKNEHGFCLRRRWAHFRLHGSVQGGGVAGWSIPSGLVLQQLRGGTSGQCTTEQRREGPPGELGKAGLGLMARSRAMFWRAAYRVRDYWHVKSAWN